MSRLRSRLAVRLAALLAALMALPLWAVPLGPARAAVLEAEFTRLSGPTRYSTSVKIAEAYMDAVDELSGTSQIDTLILGSGLDEHTGWAMPVPLLSRLHRAPLVFIRPDDVPAPVEQLIERRAVRKVLLLGGIEVIPVAVELELANLGVEVIERVGANDVHEHAVAIAESLDHPAGEFQKRGRTALLATSDVFADALAAGPMAYQGEYPILLTPSDRLHPAVFDYLLESDVEHVIIVGGTAAVGSATQRALAGLDFTVARISGIDRYATAVKLAETLLAGDGLRPCFDGAELGLAYGRLSPDAIAGSPLLGERCAPLLLTDSNFLARSVSSFLRSDKWVTGDAANDLDLFVLGGPAVVPDEVADQFVQRATTLIPIGGRITVQLQPVITDKLRYQAQEFTVRFNSDFDATRIAAAFEQGMFSVNHQRVVPTPDKDCDFDDENLDSGTLYGCVRVRFGVVTVELSDHLKPDDLVSVTGGQRIGLNNSPRPVARFSYVVPEPQEPDDRDAPDVQIVAPADSCTFALLVIEANPFQPPLHTPGELGDLIGVVDAAGESKTLTHETGWPRNGGDGTRPKHQRHLFTLDHDNAECDVTLEAGDVVTVPEGTFLDKAGRDNPKRRYTVRDYDGDFRIESVTIGDVAQGEPASATLDASTQAVTPAPTGSLRITARSDGIAAGGRGNGWRIYGPRSEISDDAKDDKPDISVTVNRLARTITYRILKGQPTFADLAAALVANRDFAANFFIDDITGVVAGSGTIGHTKGTGKLFTGGGSAVGIRVRFSYPVKSLAGRPANDRGNCKDMPLRTDIATRFGSSDTCSLTFEAPDAILHMKLGATSVSRLPSAGDLVFIDGGAACSYASPPVCDYGTGVGTNVSQGWLSIRYDADVPVTSRTL